MVVPLPPPDPFNIPKKVIKTKKVQQKRLATVLFLEKEFTIIDIIFIATFLFMLGSLTINIFFSFLNAVFDLTLVSQKIFALNRFLGMIFFFIAFFYTFLEILFFLGNEKLKIPLFYKKYQINYLGAFAVVALICTIAFLYFYFPAINPTLIPAILNSSIITLFSEKLIDIIIFLLSTISVYYFFFTNLFKIFGSPNPS